MRRQPEGRSREHVSHRPFFLAGGWLAVAVSVTGLILAPHFGSGQFAGIGVVFNMLMLEIPAALLLLVGCLLGLQAVRARPGAAPWADKIFLMSSVVLLIALIAFLFRTGVLQWLALEVP